MAHGQVGIGGAIQVPMAVPLTWRNCREFKEKLLWVRINSVSWSRNQVDGWLWGGKCSRAERPWVRGMFVYREETSTVATMVSGGRRVGRDRIISRNWLVSWTWEG